MDQPTMTAEQFKKIVEHAKATHPIWFALDADRVPTQAQISEIQQTLNVAFPEEYKEFITRFGGGYFAFAVIYSLDQDSSFYLPKHCIDVLSDFLPISDNGCGDFYGFRVIDGQCDTAISLYNHETKTSTEAIYGNLYEFLVTHGLRVKTQ